jgi:hypothetical protein
MGMISLMTAPPLVCLDIKMTNKYANSVDERGKKIGVPKSPVGLGTLDISFSHIPSDLVVAQ